MGNNKPAHATLIFIPMLKRMNHTARNCKISETTFGTSTKSPPLSYLSSCGPVPSLTSTWIFVDIWFSLDLSHTLHDHFIVWREWVILSMAYNAHTIDIRRLPTFHQHLLLLIKLTMSIYGEQVYTRKMHLFLHIMSQMVLPPMPQVSCRAFPQQFPKPNPLPIPDYCNNNEMGMRIPSFHCSLSSSPNSHPRLQST